MEQQLHDKPSEVQQGGEQILNYNEMFNKSILERRIGIDVGELVRRSDQTIKDILEMKLKTMFEGLCVKEGYIKYDSISILTYSMGVMRNDEFEYNVVFECSVCEPFNGMKIKCDVKNVTKAGLRCVVADLPLTATRREAKTPIVVFVSRDYYYDNEAFNRIKENDTINVEIIGTRYELNDNYIVAFADLVN